MACTQRPATGDLKRGAKAHCPTRETSRAGARALVGLAAALVATGLCTTAGAEELPLWELGIGAGALSAPDYRGADTQRNYALPIPYFVYRGERLRASREGVTADLLRGENWELDLSLGANLPARSRAGTPRENMPNLAPIVEFGPVLKVRLSELGAPTRWAVHLPLRHAVGLDRSGARSVGWIAAPGIHGRGQTALFGEAWNWSASLIFNGGDRRYHGYYYDVAAEHARADRPEYRAGSGYGGLSFGGGLTRRYGDVWVAGFLRASHLGGAGFADSPLVRRQANFFGGVAVTYVFAKSERMTAGEDR